MIVIRRIATAAALLLIAPLAGAQGYSPDVYEFDGSNGLAFDAAPQMRLAEGGTVEFWVAPDWSDDPGYDPVLLAYAGEAGASWLVAMLAERDGLVVAAGQDEDYFAFDFTDGQMHHVAVSQMDDGVVVFVDGRIAGVSGLNVPNLPAEGLWVGSINGEDDVFLGALAGLRVWREAIAQETLVEFAMVDVFEGDHPDIEVLSALSDFANGDVLLVESIESDAEEVAAAN